MLAEWGGLPILAAMGESRALILTLSLAVTAGGLLMVFSRRARMPAIVLLLIGGVGLGPEGVGLVQPDALGDMLGVLVSLAVGIILFEGGLTLNVAGYRAAEGIIRKLLTIGVLATWLTTSALVWLIFRYEVAFCLLAGSLVIVTGPTVIQPLLKRIRLRWRLNSVLHWEGVLIDPIGVFIALLCFEWVVGASGTGALMNLGQRLLAGLAIGFIGGEVICYALKRKLVPEEMVNVFTLSCAVLIFGVTEAFISEGGLLSVTLAGLIVGARQPPDLKAIRDFKAVITDLLIGMVFILLSARLDLSRFVEFGQAGLLLVLGVMFIVRPLTILLSGINEKLSWRELAFLSWVAPRGVVAASMSSLFALALMERGDFADPAFLETFVYSVIVATVILQGFTAGPLAALLGLQQKNPEGWLIVGAHPFGRRLAGWLEEACKLPVALCDGNRKAVADARLEGRQAFYADARDVAMIERRAEMEGVGNLLALTDNEDLNELLCQKWRENFGKERVFRWTSAKGDTPRKGEDGYGRVIWSWLPRPSQVGGELARGDALLYALDSPELSKEAGRAALAEAMGKRVSLDPAANDKGGSASKSKRKVLWLRREQDHLARAIRPDLIVRLETTTRDELLYELAALAARAAEGLEAKTIYQEIVELERAFPTSLGHGVALPHAHLAPILEPVCVVVQLTEGIRFTEEEEDEPVRLIFLVLSPTHETESHLALLGEIARLVRDAETRQKLFEAKDVETLRWVLLSHHGALANAAGNVPPSQSQPSAVTPESKAG